jgi:hypothetical protein
MHTLHKFELNITNISRRTFKDLNSEQRNKSLVHVSEAKDDLKMIEPPARRAAPSIWSPEVGNGEMAQPKERMSQL